MTSYKVGYLVGSLAKASINRLLATALVPLAPAEIQMAEIPFKDLPVYSYDYDANYPPAATALVRCAPDRLEAEFLSVHGLFTAGATFTLLASRHSPTCTSCAAPRHHKM